MGFTSDSLSLSHETEHLQSLYLSTYMTLFAYCSTTVVVILSILLFRSQRAVKQSISAPQSGFDMDRLPDELILYILSYLDEQDLVNAQSLSKRFLKLGRDHNIWKELCFEKAPAESARRRQRLSPVEDSRLSALRQAFSTLSEQNHGGSNDSSATVPSNTARSRSLASWDPRYPGDDIDFYQEYIHRYAPIAPATWLDLPKDRINGANWAHEATGFGTLRDSTGEVSELVAPLDDGSVCVWDVSKDADGDNTGTIRLAGRSPAGLLTGLSDGSDHATIATESKNIMTEVGAVDCVSINSSSKRGLFAVQNDLQEVDLRTLQIISTQSYTFPITALSEATDSTPVTVGTSSTVYVYDSRVSQAYRSSDNDVKVEVIGGPTASYAVLTQPGPLSILHHNQDDSIWIAGRFTHLLNYDRRFFPRLKGTLHSGARISCLSSLPHPHIPRDLDLVSNPSTSLAALQTAKSIPGTTLIAAGVYKGKGSLELYGLSPSSSTTPSLASKYQNRQTASTSKLLAAVPTGAHIVTSDSDGNIKWFERSGAHRIRTMNINAPAPSSDSPAPSAQEAYATGAEVPSFNTMQSQAQSQGLWNTADADAPGHGDIVRKIAPLRTGDGASGKGAQNPLLLWSGDGRVGVLGWGRRAVFTQRKGTGEGTGEEEDWDVQGEDEGYVSGFSSGSGGIRGGRRKGDGEEADNEEERLRVNARRAERRAREDAERQFAGSMRRALEGQANEARWMRGLGLGS